MLRIRSYLTALMAICLLLVGGPMLETAPESRAENVQLNQDILMPMKMAQPLALSVSENDIVVRYLAEIIACAWHSLIGCGHVPDAKSWAERVTDWQYPGGNKTDGTKANAFKHCIWMGATATRFGEQEAERIGEAHERYNTFQRNSLRKMDEANNALGANIGAIAVYNRPDDQWGFVIETCKRYADANELYGLNGIPGKYTDKEK